MTAANRREAETEDDAADKSGPRRMLSEKQVLEIIPVGRTTLYRMEKAGRFPRSTYISPNRRVWFEDEIVAWQKRRLTNSTRAGDEAKVGAILLQTDKEHHVRSYRRKLVTAGIGKAVYRGGA